MSTVSFYLIVCFMFKEVRFSFVGLLISVLIYILFDLKKSDK